MATSIVFTDGGGLVTLTNGKPSPADRFTNWVPDALLIKAEADTLAVGQPFPFVFRTDYVASFSLPKIPNTAQNNVLRLIAWLGSGGVVTVNTGDGAARSYTSCYLPKGGKPAFTLTDPRMLEYTLSLTLLNTAGAAMLCIY